MRSSAARSTCSDGEPRRGSRRSGHRCHRDAGRRDLLPLVADALQSTGRSCTVTDVGSTKAGMTAVMAAESRFPLGGHPLSGSEAHGPANARAELFDGSPWFLTPVPETDPACYRYVHDFVGSLGAEVTAIDPIGHDQLVAPAQPPSARTCERARGPGGGRSGCGARCACDCGSVVCGHDSRGGSEFASLGGHLSRQRRESPRHSRGSPAPRRGARGRASAGRCRSSHRLDRGGSSQSSAPHGPRLLRHGVRRRGFPLQPDLGECPQRLGLLRRDEKRRRARLAPRIEPSARRSLGPTSATSSMKASGTAAAASRLSPRGRDPGSRARRPRIRSDTRGRCRRSARVRPSRRCTARSTASGTRVPTRRRR